MSKSQLSGVQTVLKHAICSPFFHCCPPQSIFHSAVRIGLWNLRSEYNTLLVNTFPLFAVSVRIKPEHCANSYRSRMTSSFFTQASPGGSYTGGFALAAPSSRILAPRQLHGRLLFRVFVCSGLGRGAFTCVWERRFLDNNIVSLIDIYYYACALLHPQFGQILFFKQVVHFSLK